MPSRPGSRRSLSIGRTIPGFEVYSRRCGSCLFPLESRGRCAARAGSAIGSDRSPLFAAEADAQFRIAGRTDSSIRLTASGTESDRTIRSSSPTEVHRYTCSEIRDGLRFGRGWPQSIRSTSCHLPIRRGRASRRCGEAFLAVPGRELILRMVNCRSTFGTNNFAEFHQSSGSCTWNLRNVILS